jgi:hypothetical protein
MTQKSNENIHILIKLLNSFGTLFYSILTLFLLWIIVNPEEKMWPGFLEKGLAVGTYLVLILIGLLAN